MSAQDKVQEPIAIVGSGLRFPGSSTSPSKLWDLLIKPRDLLTKIPENRFNIDAFHHPNPDHHGTTNITQSYFLDQDHRHFDANFFNVKAVEVPAIDPQQRLLMEVVYEAIDAAGLSVESLSGTQTGVFVGLMCADYGELINRDADAIPTYTGTGTARSIMSNRISYWLNTSGPSTTIDTACSSSLVAVDQAVQLLLSGESKMAIAAGANMILGPLQYVGASKLHMLAADGRSRMWDAKASGYARGEGVAAVILKRLSDAIADGDKIDCVIRSSGVNQDGRSPGITMPSADAQKALIAQTYAKAGLDPRNPKERCQYFEAHGTGTPAGDPKEAEAISEAFFHPGDNVKVDKNGVPLYVGSVKTVIGHTEGTAGLAGLIKASLAIQKGVIPPNMLFDELHPNVEPFYTNLEVLTQPKAWPALEDGVTRRASVNSFGFGGTNAHVIIEQYVPQPTEKNKRKSEPAPPQVFTPFNFSAASEKSLRGILGDYQTYLDANPDVSLSDLSYTLYNRKSEHAIRTSISANSAAQLQAKIKDLLDGQQTSPGVRSKKLSNSIRTLGVFTGQGAQWPTMARELILHSPYAKKVTRELDAVLQNLPRAERPNWTLMGELLADSSKSRLDTALIAQPLCTVVQIILFDLIRAAGVKFQAVVGHSSGEMAAAYAAGRITREDAVKIAYYRGYFTHHTPAAKPGAMMAVGTTVEDANELCSLPMFKGRISVAAINSSTSVTISGDRDAIEEAEGILKDENKFARLLKVDKAYHSAHMIPCSQGYVEALKRCNIQPRQGLSDCAWYSSVYENREMHGDVGDLAAQYWADNMARPVLFSQAVAAACAGSGAFDLGVEVGPHAALKGPAMQTIQESHKDTIPYTGVIHRGKNDIEAVADALGYIWSQFAQHKLDFAAFDSLVSGQESSSSRSVVGDLPTYHWNHDALYWHSSRSLRAFLGQKNPPNPLLGTLTTDLMENERRWRNLLKLSELPWIRGHQLQGQVIYPATAYMATAVEAARFLAPAEQQENIAVIQVQDFALGKPLVFSDGDVGIETVFTVADITKTSKDTYSASFTFHACSSAETDQLSTHATGSITVTLGEPSATWLPSRKPDLPNLVPIPQDRFYASLEPIGYGYGGWFRTMSSIQRRMNFSSSLITVPPQDEDEEPVKILLHPALLDSALQGIFLAYCWPGDGSLEQLHVPTGIKTFRVNVPLCRSSLLPSVDVPTCSQLTGNPLATRQLNGDVEIYSSDGLGLVQMEGIKVVAFAEPTADMDRAIFSEHAWNVSSPSCELAMGGQRASEGDYEFAYAMERVSIHYMKQVSDMFPPESRKELGLEWHFECMFGFFDDVLTTVSKGERQCAKPEWVHDSDETIAGLKAAHGHRVDMQLACAVGDNLPAVLRGETTILEHMTKNNLLNRFYEVGLGLKEFSFFLGKTVKQVVHRYPRMKILEIGAGTGGATKLIMGDIGRSFASYTYTDISTGFFETAQEVFSAYSDKMIFKTLDIEKDIIQQGYEEGTYDLVVASLVLHATKDLHRTLTNARRLLKPGGQLIILEVSNNDVTRVGFLMCALPGWWLGQSDGRKLSPCVSTLEWHTAMLEAGFSGIDSSTPENDAIPYPLAVIVSQAVDDRVALLREPLSAPALQAIVNDELDVVLIGGRTLNTTQLVQKIARLLPAGTKHTVFKTLGDINTSKISTKSVILVLAELDEPVFERLTEKTLEGLQRLFETQRTVLWVTQGCRSENPYMNMSVGLGRSLVLENPDLTLQFLDVEEGNKPNPRSLLEALLRLRHGDNFEKEGQLGDGILWTNEHELAYENGDLLLSRVYQNTSLNNRYNASKRTVVETVNAGSNPVTLAFDASSSRHTLTRSHKSLAADDSSILINTTHSLLLPAFSTRPEPAYIILGTSSSSSFITTSPTNTSQVLAPTSKAIDLALPAKESSSVKFLTHLSTHLQASNILSICPPNSTLLVYEPTPEMASSILEAASDSNTTVCFATSQAGNNKNWIHIDAFSPTRAVHAVLPLGVSVFVDCSTRARITGELIAACLDKTCLKTALGQVDEVQRLFGFSADDLGGKVVFEKAVQRAVRDTVAASSNKEEEEILQVVGIQELVTGQVQVDQDRQAIIDWTATETDPKTGIAKLPVQVATVEAQVKFRGDRTYVLFGLTSDLAQSICDWMASHGARNIVLTSRTPKIDGAWVQLLAKRGVRLEAFANDITDKAALLALVADVRQNFPPIAGVAHGAMVLDDISFFEMGFDKMDKVLRPKVLGAVHLDEIFHDDSLEFFVLFSSVTAIAGNRGQAAYTTANMFMSALATQRRQRGLAASILHIGAVMGVGYINRGFSDAIFAALRKTGFMMMSEREFHLCFGEAVVASHPLSGRNPEVITALETIRSAEVQPPWAKFPRFQHCIQIEEAGDRKAKKKTATVSTKARLLEATTPAEVLEVVSDAFFQKLQLALHLPSETERPQVLASGLDDLGVDSLVAVEIRSWFLKEIETEIPVFKVLSGGSVTQLLEYAIENMPARLTPNQNGEAPASDSGVVAQSTPDSERDSSVPSLILTPNGGSAVASQTGDGNENDRFVSAATSQSDESDEPDKTAPPSPPPPPTFEKVVPISPGQSRFWFLKQLMDDQTTANSTIRVAIEGKIRIDSLEIAVRKIAARHEAFRASFFVGEDQKPVQGIAETSRLTLEKKLIGSESEVDTEFENLKNYVYDIERGECMRLIHLSLAPTKSYLLIGSHHIILDGISLEVFLNDLQRAYNGQSLPENAFQYSDYSEKLHQELSSGALRGEINHWKTELANPPAPLPLLPFSATKSRTTLAGYSHTSVSRTVPPALAKKIEKTCSRLKANMFHFYLGVFELLLFKLLGTTDICIGMADANRWEDGVAQSIGMYLNLLPLRFNLDNTKTFETVLKETRRKAYLAMSHSRLPFDVLLENISCERSTAFSPLFQAFINYRQGVSDTRRFDGATGTTEEISLPRAGYDISLDIIENPGRDTKVIFMLQKSLYGEEETSRVLDMYFKLLSDVCEASGQKLEKISLFSQGDINEAVKLGRGPALASAWPETLPGRIEDIITKSPTTTAIKDPIDGHSWTYKQLSGEVSRISSALLAAGVTKGSVVAVFQEASTQLVFSLLAILRVGAIYAPLDINIPSARLQVMLAECKPSAVLVSARTASKTGDLGLSSSVTVLDVSNLPNRTSSREVKISASDPAAILFTSGTSGVPKGVVLSHGNWRNHVESLTVTHGFGVETVLQQSSVGFDMSLNQILIALSNGGTLVIVPESLRKDFAAVSQIIVNHEITYTSATPSEYLAWFRHGSDNLLSSKSWRFATAGGEQFSPELVQVLRQLKGRFEHSFRIFNAYGPTECSFSSNEKEVNLDMLPITAGGALPNYAVCIVDEDLKPVPVGFPGEICISGAGVAVGYLNNFQETTRKFVKTSFSDKAYRTGDRGVLRHDGTLEILGRIDGDTQVKLRGLRIELKDIEQSIMAAAKGQINDVVVTPRGNPTILIAHAVLSSTASSHGTQEFLQSLAASLPLPQYMRPTAILAIDRIPLTSSGKIDRISLQALPIPTASQPNVAGNASLTDTEQLLSQIWESVVPRLGSINPNSDFFHVGGNSMLLIELGNLITRDFGVTLPLIRLFEQSTLSAMASAITSADGNEPSQSSINWTSETCIPPAFHALSNHNSQEKPPATPPKTIILTGATGFLGQHILSALLSNPSVTKVHAVAVRSPSKLSRFAASAKLEIYFGDLSHPNLGLSTAAFGALSSTADAVIHNGADVSFLKSYPSLRAANVTSTKSLVELALLRKIPIHFISTGTVGKLIGGESLAPKSLAEYIPGEGFKDGYAASKWVSEVFLEKAGKELGLPVVVHRPSSVIGGQEGEGDVVASVVKYAEIVKAVPDSKGWKGFVDLVGVDEVVRGVIDKVFDKKAEGGVDFVHHSGGKVVPAGEIGKVLKKDDEEWRVLGMEEWAERAVDEGMNPLVGEFLRKAAEGGRALQIGQRLL